MTFTVMEPKQYATITVVRVDEDQATAELEDMDDPGHTLKPRVGWRVSTRDRD